MTLPKMTSKIFAAAVFAATIPLAGPTSAAPLAQSIALKTADVGAVEQVQYRRWHGSRWHGGRWIGPAAAAGFAAGAIVGSALAPHYYNDGYYAYGAAPGYADGYYAYGAAPGYVAGPRYGGLNRNFGNGSAATSPGSAPSCPSDREQSSAYPSWMCR
jgi:hypothetical protein